MKNKKRNSIFIFLCCILLACVCIGIAGAQGATITVNGEIKNSYARGDRLNLPTAKLSLGQNEYAMKSTLTYPDGRVSTDSKLILDVLGSYMLTYSVEVEGATYTKDYSFMAEDKFQSLFTYADNVYCEGEMEIPSYIDREQYVGRTQGVKFTFTESNATMRYNGIIDLREIGFASSQRTGELHRALPNEFIEFLITPDDNSTKEMERLDLKIIDVYDETNFIHIDMTAADKTMKYPYTSYTGVVAGDKYDSMGYHNLTLSTTGCNVGTSFYGQSGEKSAGSVRFYFDVDTLDYYVFPRTPEYRQTDVLFDKLDDTQTVGLGNEWFGFTTGEVYLELTATEVTQKESSIMILSVAGHELSSFAGGDTAISIVTGDIDGDGDVLDLDNLPYAVAGANNYYPVFDAIAYHPVGGVLSGLSTKVYYGENRENVVITDGKFKTENVGTYYIEYSLDGAYGEAKKILPIQAKSAYDAQDVPDYILSSELVSSAGVGDRILLTWGQTVGGSGIWTQQVSVKHRSSYSQEWSDVSLDGSEEKFIIIEEPGEYVATFKGTDMVGTVIEKIHTINVSYDTVPRMSEVPVQTSAIKGYSLVFPKPVAKYIGEAGESEVKVEIFVGGEDYTNKPYIVDEDFTVIYKATLLSDDTKYTQKSYNVKAVDLADVPSASNNDALFTQILASYFTSSELSGSPDVVTSIANGKNIQFKTSVNNANVRLNNSILFETFDITVSPADYMNYGAIDLVLTDYKDISENIVISLIKTSSNKLKLALNGQDVPLTIMSGGTAKPVTPNFAKVKFYVEKYFEEIEVSATEKRYEDRYRLIFTTGAYEFKVEVPEFENGTAFNGFSSKRVFLDMALTNVTGQASFKVEKICNTQYEPDNFISNIYLNKFIEISDVNDDQKADFTTLTTADNMIFSTNVDGASFNFVRKIPIDLFSVVFEASANRLDNTFDAISVYLTDSEKMDEVVKLSVLKVEKNGIIYSQFCLNDKPIKAISGSLNGASSTPFEFTYRKSERAIYDALGIKLGEIDAFMNGVEFNGFTSGYVYMRMELEGVTGDTSVRLKTIAKQPFNANIVKDNTDALIMYSKDVSRNVYISQGSSYTVYSATAYDVLSEVRSLTVTVETPTRAKIYNGEISSDKSFVFDTLGQYRITYTVEDSQNNSLKSIFYVYVQEENAPTVNVSGAPKSVYYVGDKYKVGKATVTDDSDDECVLTIYIHTPTLRMNLVKQEQEITFTEPGYYTLNYYARDKFYNRTTITYGILVIEKTEG